MLEKPVMISTQQMGMDAPLAAKLRLTTHVQAQELQAVILFAMTQ